MVNVNDYPLWFSPVSNYRALFFALQAATGQKCFIEHFMEGIKENAGSALCLLC